MVSKKSRDDVRKKRHRSIRRRLSGTTERPRLAVYRSGKHIYAQVIDDLTGQTLVSASTIDKELKGSMTGTATERARKVGEAVGSRAKEKGLLRVVFDRAGFKYHGRVAALADGARAQGLEF